MNNKHPVNYLVLIIALSFFLVWYFSYRDGTVRDVSITSSDKTEVSAEDQAGLDRITKFEEDTSPVTNSRARIVTDASNDVDVSHTNATIQNPFIDDPESLVAEYLYQMASGKLQRYQDLWPKILACPACVDLIKQNIESGSINDNALLEFTHLLLEADHSVINSMMSFLVNPVREGLTQRLFIQQVIRKGNAQSYEALLHELQSYDETGMRDFVLRQVDLLSGIIAPDTLQPTLDLALGHTNASLQLQTRVRQVMLRRMESLPEDEEITRQLIDYYYNASDVDADLVWQLLSRNSSSLIMIALDAELRAETDVVEKAVNALKATPSAVAINAIMKLYDKINRPQQYFIDAIISVVTRDPGIDALHQLENNLRATDQSLQGRIVAAEGLLAVKDNEQSRYILEKMIQSSDYSDAEVVSYINGRL